MENLGYLYCIKSDKAFGLLVDHFYRIIYIKDDRFFIDTENMKNLGFLINNTKYFLPLHESKLKYRKTIIDKIRNYESKT